MIELPPVEELPATFKYPDEFLWVLKNGVNGLTPWLILESESILPRYVSLKKRYPSRNLFPFACRQDCDELACWDLNDNNRIKIIDDYSRANPNDDVIYNNFLDWFRQAVEDMKDFCIKDIQE